MLWIVIGVALAIAEIFTVTLLLIMLSAGAFAAAAVAALGAPILAQVLVFAAVSALTVGAIRPVIRRHRMPASETGERPFGIEAMEGASGLVMEQVDAEHGVVKLDGELWTARSFDGTETFPPGDRVRIVKVRGTTVLVWHDDRPLL